ncbi:hypothetical protein T4D_11909 [Trichinella pseudospiralis]|uniref:Uncharacterized protein n=1 Tax=Trichinella pseudospiralis TaxID=6337 RepID=A0A0V1FD77_TRIPS|nr:hypothetical protein T4D_11909 [Trichinella pseudospiralis]
MDKSLNYELGGSSNHHSCLSDLRHNDTIMFCIKSFEEANFALVLCTMENEKLSQCCDFYG